MGRVPAYSPSSIAEYAVSSVMALSKNIQKSYELTKEADFTIGGLQCILLEDKVAGIIGTGLIGKKTVQKIAGLVPPECLNCVDSNCQLEEHTTEPQYRYNQQNQELPMCAEVRADANDQ